MKEKPWLYFGLTFITYAVCLYTIWDASESNNLILYSLTILSLVAFKLLLSFLKVNTNVATVILIAATAMLLTRFGSPMLPVAAVLIVDVSERIAGKYFVYLSLALIVLLGLIMGPGTQTTLIIVLVVPSLLFITYILNRLDDTRELLEKSQDEAYLLRNTVASQRKLAQTTEYAARLNERNRLAGRIHDRIGHGVSGSILLLEAAMLTLDKDKDKAKCAINQATENLRESVDDIRAALREERSSKGEAGLAEIKNELARFDSAHAGITTKLVTEGALDDVSPSIWIAIYENLKETLTNLLNHSTGDTFTVTVTRQNKLIRVEFKDNGTVDKAYKPDIGLNNMEDRCAILGGRCFFQAGKSGFRTTMIFREDV